MLPNTTQDEDVKKLISLLKEFKSLFFITVSPEGKVGMRPMKVVEFEDHPYLWFVSDRYAHKVQDSIGSGNVYITAQSGESTFVTARGVPEVFTDRRTKDKLWSEPLRAWFPKGKDDEELCFIRVELKEGEYWDTSGMQKVYYFVETVESFLSGTRPSIDHEQHSQVRVS